MRHPAPALMPSKSSSRVRQLPLKLSFFRLHLLAGLFVPLIAAAIAYGSNGKNHLQYIDLLFCECAGCQIPKDAQPSFSLCLSTHIDWTLADLCFIHDKMYASRNFYSA